MHARIAALSTRIDALSLRERGTLLLVSLLVVYLFADQLFVVPALQGISQRNTEIAELQTKLTALQARANLLNRTGQDPIALRQARIAELEAQVATQDSEFEAQLGRLVRPQQAAPLLREILQRQPRLRLRSLDTAPGAPLLSSERNARVIRYDVELRVEGGYLAALDYLQRLEQLPWTLFWDALELHAQEHPTNEVRLSLYTLGQRP